MSKTAFRIGACVASAFITLGVVVSTASANGVHAHAFGSGGNSHVAAWHGGGFRGHPQAFAGTRVHAGMSVAPRSFAPALHNSFPVHRAVLATPASPIAHFQSTHYAASRYGLSARVGYSSHRVWRGGYWRGTYWPRAYYYAGFPWFLATLPVFYTTFWFGGVPYYYVDDVYYTWSADDNGYVVANPPPAVSASADLSDGVAGKVYAYPKNGQSGQQQMTDEQECQQWASGQSSKDSMAADSAPVSSADYHRATVACLEGHGYSAK